MTCLNMSCAITTPIQSSCTQSLQKYYNDGMVEDRFNNEQQEGYLIVQLGISAGNSSFHNSIPNYWGFFQKVMTAEILHIFFSPKMGSIYCVYMVYTPKKILGHFKVPQKWLSLIKTNFTCEKAKIRGVLFGLHRPHFWSDWTSEHLK